MERLRIDASLHRVEAPFTDELRKASQAFSEGMFDCSSSSDEAARRLSRAMMLETVAFNELLNTATAVYGVHVDNVPDDQPEHAVGYGRRVPQQHRLLPVARTLRSSILPAVSAVYRADARQTRAVLGPLFDEFFERVPAA